MSNELTIWHMDKKDRKRLIAESLKLHRVEKNFTQKQLADKIGVNLTTYNSYETGVSEPCAEILVRLSHVLDISTDDLLQRNQLDPTGSISAINKFREEYEIWLKNAEETNNPQLIQIVKGMKKAMDQQIDSLLSPENMNSQIAQLLREELNIEQPTDKKNDGGT